MESTGKEPVEGCRRMTASRGSACGAPPRAACSPSGSLAWRWPWGSCRCWTAIAVLVPTLAARRARLGRPEPPACRARRDRPGAERARRLADQDGLTGIGNYRAFWRALRGECARAERYGGAFTLAVIDLDDFKRVNDEHGHRVGDDVLRAVARALAEASAPRTPCVAREATSSPSWPWPPGPTRPRRSPRGWREPWRPRRRRRRSSGDRGPASERPRTAPPARLPRRSWRRRRRRWRPPRRRVTVAAAGWCPRCARRAPARWRRRSLVLRRPILGTSRHAVEPRARPVRRAGRAPGRRDGGRARRRRCRRSLGRRAQAGRGGGRVECLAAAGRRASVSRRSPRTRRRSRWHCANAGRRSRRERWDSTRRMRRRVRARHASRRARPGGRRGLGRDPRRERDATAPTTRPKSPWSRRWPSRSGAPSRYRASSTASPSPGGTRRTGRPWRPRIPTAARWPSSPPGRGVARAPAGGAA